jgi:hypothetical protein
LADRRTMPAARALKMPQTRPGLENLWQLWRRCGFVGFSRFGWCATLSGEFDDRG